MRLESRWRPKSRRENPVAICTDHRDAARIPGSPMARGRRLENPPALGVEHRVNAGDRSGRHVRDLSFSGSTKEVAVWTRWRGKRSPPGLLTRWSSQLLM